MDGFITLVELRMDGTHHECFVRADRVTAVRQLTAGQKHPQRTSVVTCDDLWLTVVETPAEVVAKMRAAVVPPRVVNTLRTSRDRLADMLAGDDGQAWDEARKFLPHLDATIALMTR